MIERVNKLVIPKECPLCGGEVQNQDDNWFVCHKIGSMSNHFSARSHNWDLWDKPKQFLFKFGDEEYGQSFVIDLEDNKSSGIDWDKIKGGDLGVDVHDFELDYVPDKTLPELLEWYHRMIKLKVFQ